MMNKGCRCTHIPYWRWERKLEKMNYHKLCRKNNHPGFLSILFETGSLFETVEKYV